MRGDQLVIPEEILYPQHEKASQAVAQSKAEMDSSSKSAILAAAQYLHRDIALSDVTVKLRDTGGPSAGLAFALALVAKIGDPQLFTGHTIAATGTITSKGAVGAIGGIDQKLIGAAHSHAEAVFIPVDNCADITRTPTGLRVIPVATLTQAVAIMRTYSSAPAGALPHC
jgi:PDZ domain-containing protein